MEAKIQKAVGEIGQVLLDIVPDLELIIGPQPDAPQLGAAESENRFLVLFKNFIRVFADEDQPLVFYLDDLQWIDLSSLKLLERILGDKDLKYFFFIGAYRNKEVTPTHPLSHLLKSSRKMKMNLYKWSYVHSNRIS